MFHIAGMEFHTGRNRAWHLVGESEKDDVDDERFDIGLAIELIKTQRRPTGLTSLCDRQTRRMTRMTEAAECAVAML